MKTEESNLIKHAKSEFRALGWCNENDEFECEMQELMCKGALDLLEVFSNQGHSGSSAPYAISLFEKLARFKPIGPLTGEDSEWNEVGPGVFQNVRCHHVFKQDDRFNGQAYDIDGIVFYEWVTDEDGKPYKSCFTSGDSFVPIAFPYTPTTEYREVTK